MITDFNNPEKPVIIGLDHGYGNMKTAHTCFQTGVTLHDKEPPSKAICCFMTGSITPSARNTRSLPPTR